MPVITQTIHQGIDPFNCVHHFCLLYNLQVLSNGLVLTQPNGQPALFTAQLDTGATNTYLGQGIVDLLNPELDREEDAGMGGGFVRVSIFRNTGIILPEGLGQFDVPLRTSGARYAQGMGAGYHMIIGMDILSQCIFSINGPGNEYTLEH